MLEKIQSMTLMLISHVKAKRSDRGAAAVEYGLLVALIAVVIVTIVTTMGTDLQDVFQAAVDMFP